MSARIKKKTGKVQSVTMAATISLGNYDSIKLSATTEGCDFTPARQCLIDEMKTLGRQSPATADLVDAYCRRVFGA